MKKLLSILLALSLCLCAAGCASKTESAPDPASAVHKIGVIVYNLGDEEVIGIREYLQGYIESNFEMAQFIYSDSIRTGEQELAFIREACDAGAEGFLSFTSHDLAAEVALCGQNGAYYLMASGTVAEEDFESVADDPWFLGVFGPGEGAEYQAGADMAAFFADEGSYFILSGGAPLGNEMHYQRTLGILETLSGEYGAHLTPAPAELAASDAVVTASDGGLTVTVCPGYVDFEDFLDTARAAYEAGNYAAVMSVLPPGGMADVVSGARLGIVDSYNTRNLQLFNGGRLDYLVGKYSSVVGPAFALMLNAVTGYAADFRENGRAVHIAQDFWVSDSREDFEEKYALSTSAALNAYNFDDLSRVCRIFHSDAGPEELTALAEASSYEAVLARRGVTAPSGQ